MSLRPILRLGLLASALMLPLAASAPASACPNCKSGLAVQESEGGRADFATGFSRSIILMLAIPFGMFSIGTVAVVRMARKGSIPQL
ncbi:hypothetical protein [Tautonia rosea]|uniref:hypothetical protein n=1 Tax=Tautonia rosea TaxID=2728037 RepID=UPI001472F85D|nr:hypothetical protein [Tautonia rosea]